ncbi:hypothetical protein [uncultured Methanobrevibacter sp.]|uniref:hypothetical protein n=1 Tax=uncultured Methanobrevibacter sp. TaxID=253161 RepID=UPI0025D7A9E7|nr:hypothetical protein [uncultured Methanobrevibacter sp.]
MKKNFLIVCSIILIGVLAFGFITTTMNGVNQSIKDLNKEIIDGDESYNKAVIDLNNENYDSAANELTNSVQSFQRARDILNRLDHDDFRLNNQIYATYLNLTSQELEYKQNASTLLLNATIALKGGYVSSGNDYIYKAGYAMSDALNYQYQRANLVKDNPEKFENTTL